MNKTLKITTFPKVVKDYSNIFKTTYKFKIFYDKYNHRNVIKYKINHIKNNVVYKCEENTIFTSNNPENMINKIIDNVKIVNKDCYINVA